MKDIDISYRTMFADLNQRTMEAQLVADFPLEGWFLKVKVKNHDYWYFDIPAPKARINEVTSTLRVTKRSVSG